MVGATNRPVLGGIHWETPESLLPEFVRRAGSAGRQNLQNSSHEQPRDQSAYASREPTQGSGTLSPVSVSVHAQLIQDTARVTVAQLFVNNSNNSIPSASYTFPLPHGCTVIAFTCRIGRDRLLEGRVRPRNEARTIFEEATARNETAGLLDQHTPEVFTTTLGNIPPNSRTKVKISLLNLLKYKFEQGHGLITFTLPRYIAPRYGDRPTTLQQDASSFGTMQSFAIQVGILATEEITSISCPSHQVTVEMGAREGMWQSWREFAEAGGQENPRCALVTLNSTVSGLDSDFILTIHTHPEEGLEVPKAIMEQHPSFDGHRAVMLTIPERFMLQNRTETHAAEIIFVADRSGSMQDKIQTVKSALQFFLRGIPQGKHFNIWSFGSSYECLWRQSAPYSEQTLQAALSYVSGHFQADMGGTELLPVLNGVLNNRRDTDTTDIVVLTDGEVWDLHGTLNLVRHTRRATEGRVRLFSLGIGDVVSHALVEGLAKAGGGYAEVISPTSQTGLEPRVVAVLHAALSGHIGPIRLDLDGTQNIDFLLFVFLAQQQPSVENDTTGAPQSALKSPVDSSTLSPFLRNRIFILYESPNLSLPFNNIRLRASRPGGEEITELVRIDTLENSDSMIHKFAARALLGDLEEQQSHLHIGPHALLRNTPEQAAAVRSEGERLGCKWSLVSQWTSFYAIEERSREGIENDDLEGHLSVELVDQEDLGLLRPRGLQTYLDGNLIDVVRLEESDDEDGEDDEEADAESASSDRRSDDERDDPDRDDGQGGSGHAGGQGDNHDTNSDRGGFDNPEGNGADNNQPSLTGDSPNATEGGLHGTDHDNSAISIPSVFASHGGPVFPSYRNTYIQPPTGETRSKDSKERRNDSKFQEYIAVSDPCGSKDLKQELSEWMTTASEYHTWKESAKSTIHLEASQPPTTTVSPMIAPAFNIPASTSMLEAPEVVPITLEDEAKQEVVKKLITLQGFDGSFCLSQLLLELFGALFLQGVGLLEFEVRGWIIPGHEDKVKTVSITSAIATLLATRFQFLEPLWRLMVVKSKSYTSSHIQAAGHMKVEMKAESLFATMSLRRYHLRRIDSHSITAQILASIEPAPLAANQATDALPKVPGADLKLSPTNEEQAKDPQPQVPMEQKESSQCLPNLQETAVRRKISLEFAPLDDEHELGF